MALQKALTCIENGEEIDISIAEKGVTYYCPACKVPVHPRISMQRTPHFACYPQGVHTAEQCKDIFGAPLKLANLTDSGVFFRRTLSPQIKKQVHVGDAEKVSRPEMQAKVLEEKVPVQRGLNTLRDFAQAELEGGLESDTLLKNKVTLGQVLILPQWLPALLEQYPFSGGTRVVKTTLARYFDAYNGQKDLWALCFRCIFGGGQGDMIEFHLVIHDGVVYGKLFEKLFCREIVEEAGMPPKLRITLKTETVWIAGDWEQIGENTYRADYKNNRQLFWQKE